MVSSASVHRRDTVCKTRRKLSRRASSAAVLWAAGVCGTSVDDPGLAAAPGGGTTAGGLTPDGSPGGCPRRLGPTRGPDRRLPRRLGPSRWPDRRLSWRLGLHSCCLSPRRWLHHCRLGCRDRSRNLRLYPLLVLLRSWLACRNLLRLYPLLLLLCSRFACRLLLLCSSLACRLSRCSLLPASCLCPFPPLALPPWGWNPVQSSKKAPQQERAPAGRPYCLCIL